MSPTRRFSFAATLALLGLSLTTHAQQGDKMLKKEGKVDAKMVRENRRARHDGHVTHGESLSKEPKLVKKDDKRDHRRTASPR